MSSLQHVLMHPGARRSGSAPLVASFALLLAAGAQPAFAQQQRVEIIRRGVAHAEAADSTDRQMRRLQRQLDSLSRAYDEGQGLSANERRRVAEQIARTVDGLMALSDKLGDEMAGEGIRVRVGQLGGDQAASGMSRAVMQVQMAQQAVPMGWIGIVTAGPHDDPHMVNGELIVRYFSYPIIVSVDPSSPAERAGLVASDTLLAYDGRDIRDHDLSLTRLLRPNAKISVRIRRDGKVREVPVTVAAVPSRIVQRRDDEARDVRAPWAIAGVPEAPSFPRAPMPRQAGGTMRASVQLPAMAPMAPSTPSAPMAPQEPMMPLVFLNNGVAGAQLTTISEGLAKTIGVRAGVLVTSSPVGSLANDSGLEDGDVITKVGGRAVRTVLDVRGLVGMAFENGAHEVGLEILRQKRTQKISLRW
jgi:S1-C subfamily serine protease